MANSTNSFKEGLHAEQFMQRRRIEAEDVVREQLLRTIAHVSSKPQFLSFEPITQLAPKQHEEKISNPRGIFEAFVKTCQRWELDLDSQITLLGCRENISTGHQILSGHIISPSQDIVDRAGYIVGISLGLGALFGEAIDAEIDWLKCPRKKLQNKSPLEYMLEGHLVNLFAIAEMVRHERGQ
ncbi:MAG: hypothetical protein OXJ38_05355 [Gammaproteobacteria bacterium]|nr:hypothetical protein [Gammaproteobacteria bacterium]